MKTREEANAVFAKEYGVGKDGRINPNFITPEVWKRGWVDDDVAFEISSGRGIEPGTTIVGLTLVRVDTAGGTIRLPDMSKCFSYGSNVNRGISKAHEEIERLREEEWPWAVSA